MKKLLYILTAVMLLSACRSSKSYLERSDEDKALQDAIKKLDKKPGDDDASSAIPILYSNIKNAHQAKIRSFNNSKEIRNGISWLMNMNNCNRLTTALSIPQEPLNW